MEFPNFKAEFISSKFLIVFRGEMPWTILVDGLVSAINRINDAQSWEMKDWPFDVGNPDSWTDTIDDEIGGMCCSISCGGDDYIEIIRVAVDEQRNPDETIVAVFNAFAGDGQHETLFVHRLCEAGLQTPQIAKVLEVMSQVCTHCFDHPVPCHCMREE